MLLRLLPRLKNNLLLTSARVTITIFRYNSHKKMDSETRLQLFKYCIPPLDRTSHKGQAGRIGIIGGSTEYTGAPYFAAISALKVGADLVHVFCPSSAAPIIKSYSPELIVHPVLDRICALKDLTPWLHTLHAIVIGPGLGRNPVIGRLVMDTIKIIKGLRIPLVIDADGLALVSQNLEMFTEFQSPVILTPNEVEYRRLFDCQEMKGPTGFHILGNNVLILKKGDADELFSTSPEVEWKSNVNGSGRRCGGQGDLLSGSIATFFHWTLWGVIHSEKIDKIADVGLLSGSLACYAGSRLVRLCNEKAFKLKGRSMLASDMIDFIHESYEELFGQ